MQPDEVGVARSKEDNAGKERKELAKEESNLTEGESNGITNQKATVKDDFAQSVANDYSGGDLAGEFDTGPPPFSSSVAREFSGGDSRGEFGGIPTTIPNTTPDVNTDWTPPASALQNAPPIPPRATGPVDQFGGNSQI